MKELWRYIDGYDQMYEISSFGRVKSYKRNQPKMLTPMQDRYGYLVIRLCKNSIEKKFKLHRLVAQYFVENPNNYNEVNHKDGNKANNSFENLEWVTRSQNLKHAFRLGLKTGTGGGGISKGEANGRHKLTKAEVLEIRNKYIFGSTIYGSVALAKEYGVCKKTIQAIVNNQTWKDLKIEEDK